MLAGGGAAGNGGTAHAAVGEDYVSFNSRVAARIENFAAGDVYDVSHSFYSRVSSLQSCRG